MTDYTGDKISSIKGSSTVTFIPAKNLITHFSSGDYLRIYMFNGWKIEGYLAYICKYNRYLILNNVDVFEGSKKIISTFVLEINMRYVMMIELVRE